MASSLKAKVKRIGGIGQTRDMANPSDRHLLYDDNALHEALAANDRTAGWRTPLAGLERGKCSREKS
jgi:hypothetical protein